MPVKQNAVLVLRVSRVHVNNKERAPALVFDWSDLATLQILPLNKGLEVVTLAIKVAVLFPKWVIQR
jgi:hypothetical protein